MNRKRWILRALGILAMLLVLWVAATLFLSPAYANALPFSMDVRSKLLADYDADDGKSLFAALRLSILGDSLVDQGLSPEEAEKRRLALENSLDDPVPTATALDFDGSAPYTATPTITPTPTNTPTPTSTPTNTPRPTSTPTKTNTPKPTNTPGPPTATSGPVDTQKPSICCMDLIPTPGASPPGPQLSTCTIQVNDLHVFDPAFSSGVSDTNVQLKYMSPSVSWTPVTLSLITGGWVGSDWDAHYGGMVTFSGVKSGEVIQVEGRVQDNAGTGWRYTGTYYFDYIGPDC